MMTLIGPPEARGLFILYMPGAPDTSYRSGWWSVSLRPELAEQQIAFMRSTPSQKFSVVLAEQDDGYNWGEFDFRAIADVAKDITIVRRPIDNMERMEQFEWLTGLALPDCPLSFSVRKLTGLQSISVCKGQKIDGLGNLTELVDLSVKGTFKGLTDEATLLPLTKFSKLHFLYVNSSRIAALDGIEKLALKRLHVVIARNLRTITAIEKCKTLQSLRLVDCKNVESLASLSKLTELRELLLENAGSMPSLRNLSALEKLEYLIFPDTVVLDGRITILLEQNRRLVNVGFDDRRSYDLTVDQLNAKLKSRGPQK